MTIQSGRLSSLLARLRPALQVALFQTFFVLIVSPQPGEAQIKTAGDGTVYLEARAFESDVMIQILPFGEQRDHRDTLLAALEAINSFESLADPDGQTAGGIGEVNRNAGKGGIRVDAKVADALVRALNFCRWSKQAHGPLGGNLYGLWGLRSPVYGFPKPDVLADQTELAACDRLTVDPASSMVDLPAGSRLDLWGFARGAAVDAAIETLESSGAASGWVQIGIVMRAFGPGLHTGGWPAKANPTDNQNYEERVMLRDQAMAMAGQGETMLDISGELFAPYIHQKQGRPSSQNYGTLAVLVISELAIDAQGLATALFVMPPREGQYRLGILKPPPAVLWMQGTGVGRPLVEERGWAKLEKW